MIALVQLTLAYWRENIDRLLQFNERPVLRRPRQGQQRGNEDHRPPTLRILRRKTPQNRSHRSRPRGYPGRPYSQGDAGSGRIGGVWKTIRIQSSPSIAILNRHPPKPGRGGDESPRSSGLRRRRPPEVRQALLDEFESLGLSARQFARQRKLCYQTLLSWIRARRRQKASGAGSDYGFAEVVPDSKKAGSGGGILSIRLPGGAVLEIRNRNELPAAAELLSLVVPCGFIPQERKVGDLLEIQKMNSGWGARPRFPSSCGRGGAWRG